MHFRKKSNINKHAHHHNTDTLSSSASIGMLIINCLYFYLFYNEYYVDKYAKYFMF